MAVYGAAMAVMNVAYYCTVGRLPLGVAATLLFLGPFVVAVASARAWREALLPAVGLAGVVLVTEPGGTVEWAGIAFGLLSALALACYTVFAQRVGRASTGLEGLALSVCISAMLLLPFSIPAAPSVNGSDWGLVAVSGVSRRGPRVHPGFPGREDGHRQGGRDVVLPRPGDGRTDRRPRPRRKSLRTGAPRHGTDCVSRCRSDMAC